MLKVSMVSILLPLLFLSDPITNGTLIGYTLAVRNIDAVVVNSMKFIVLPLAKYRSMLF